MKLGSPVMKVQKIDVNNRLDRYILDYLRKNLDSPEAISLSRDFVSGLIPEYILVDGAQRKSSLKLRLGMDIQIDLVGIKAEVEKRISENERLSDILAEKGELDIIEETSDYVVIRKAHGMVVHPGYKNSTGTLANIYKGYLTSKGEYDPMLERAGIVHRLDKGVGGVMILAKNRATQLYFKKEFEEHKVLKIYRAKVDQIHETSFSRSLKFPNSKKFQLEEFINDVASQYMNGIDVTSSWEVIEGYVGRDKVHRKRMVFVEHVKPLNDNSFKIAKSQIFPITDNEFLIRILTGRMHQIRATLRTIGYSIKGDMLYRSGDLGESENIALDSILLGVNFPKDGKKVWLI